MPNWNELHDEIFQVGSKHDILRRKYLKKMQEHRGRNVIAYYSGWLQKEAQNGVEVNNADKNGFMSVTNRLDKSKGLDLILHTPGGDVAAAESLIVYLRQMFGTDINVFVPQLAMSAGTMIACCAKEIYLGQYSSLGPIDPQLGTISAKAVIEETERAKQELLSKPSTEVFWQPILAKYTPAFIIQCEKAIELTTQIVKELLQTGMFSDLRNDEKENKSEKIVKFLENYDELKIHSRQLSTEQCKEIGLKVVDIENDCALEDIVVSVHNMFMHTFSATSAKKIIENHDGIAFIHSA